MVQIDERPQQITKIRDNTIKTINTPKVHSSQCLYKGGVWIETVEWVAMAQQQQIYSEPTAVVAVAAASRHSQNNTFGHLCNNRSRDTAGV